MMYGNQSNQRFPMAKVMSLEIQKQRRSFLSVLAVSCIGLLGSCVSGNMATGILLLAGLPLVAIVFGTTSAIGMRRNPEQSIEEVLPVDTVSRIAAAYFVSVIQVLTIGLLLYAAFALPQLLEYARREDPAFLSAIVSGEISCVCWGIVATMHLHLLSFLLSYWFSHVFLGGGLALILTAVESCLMIGSVTTYYSGFLPGAFAKTQFEGSVLPVILSSIGIVIAGYLLAKSIGRGVRPTPWKAAVIVLALGSGTWFCVGRLLLRS